MEKWKIEWYWSFYMEIKQRGIYRGIQKKQKQWVWNSQVFLWKEIYRLFSKRHFQGSSNIVKKEQCRQNFTLVL
ncbi:unnamed protein product [Paramecium octaurelia]|uniref:Uncharacterized protein n=1 Tax=Paramecium octaurelia TaxID=43137 RepID=A0A8S1T2L0_PAROT|nr:unnamed protein product [Paramecium octaurelia]